MERKCLKVHVLHATQFGGGPNASDTPGHEKDDTVIGEYRINYEDKTSASFPIVYGKDVRDWYYVEGPKEELERGKIAWHGENPYATRIGAKIRLYHGAWQNPRPDTKIVSIDYISRKDATPCMPFCLAITLEMK